MNYFDWKLFCWSFDFFFSGFDIAKKPEKEKVKFIDIHILPETLPNLPYQRRAHMHERFAVPTVDRHSIRLNYLEEIVANFKKVKKNIQYNKIRLLDQMNPCEYV